MLTIDTLEIGGFASAMKAVRLSYKKEALSWMASQISATEDGMYYDTTITFDRERKDLELLSRLVKAGDEHAKPLRGIMVWCDVTAPIYWWYEMETYRLGHERLMSESTMHSECRNLTGAELQDAKAKIPMGHMHRKVDCFSYQTLRRIYQQRKNHRLPEWHEFTAWIETLPFAKELITG